MPVEYQTLLRQLSWEILEHPPYSPEFSACHYHILGSLQKALLGRRFPDDNEIQAAVENWFRNQHRSFFIMSWTIETFVSTYKTLGIDKKLHVEGYRHKWEPKASPLPEEMDLVIVRNQKRN
ncbi:hypothetical protein TNCV_853351 [Trichonephila clavipes]|nr:hypothetical protein TNCV_853351 [Trichonephila clavipes]